MNKYTQGYEQMVERHKKKGPVFRPALLLHRKALSAAQIDDRAAVLGLAHIRTGRHHRIVEGLAFDRDGVGAQALMDHLILDGLSAAH